MPPRRDQRMPDWMDPEAALNRRDYPHLTYSLETLDGGKTWKSSTASLFGQITRLRFGAPGLALGLIEYNAGFRYPSEVYKVDTRSGKSQTQSLYRDRRFAVSDIWLTKDNVAYLAGTQVVGQVRNVAPGKVQVLRTSDFSVWTEMAVDYKADREPGDAGGGRRAEFVARHRQRHDPQTCSRTDLKRLFYPHGIDNFPAANLTDSMPAKEVAENRVARRTNRLTAKRAREHSEGGSKRY